MHTPTVLHTRTKHRKYKVYIIINLQLTCRTYGTTLFILFIYVRRKKPYSYVK